MTARQKVPLTDYTEPVFAENLSSSPAPLIRDTLSVSGGDDEDPSEHICCEILSANGHQGSVNLSVLMWTEEDVVHGQQPSISNQSLSSSALSQLTMIIKHLFPNEFMMGRDV